MLHLPFDDDFGTLSDEGCLPQITSKTLIDLVTSFVGVVVSGFPVTLIGCRVATPLK